MRARGIISHTSRLVDPCHGKLNILGRCSQEVLRGLDEQLKECVPLDECMHELDTLALELRLPAQKQKSHDKFFRNHKPFCKSKELESLIGLLQEAQYCRSPRPYFPPLSD